MIKHNQNGAVSGLGISLVLAITLLVVAAVFGGWAFASREDYKNNVDAKIHVAVTAAQNVAVVTEKAQLAQDEKQPYDSYQGPAAYGSIAFQYPRTWSSYVNAAGSPLIDGYYMAPILSSVSDQTANFALRVQVIAAPYSQVAPGVAGTPGGKNPITSTAYALKLVPGSVGIEASGPLGIAPGSTATMVILPDRTNTIEIWTDGTAYLSDFNNVILPSFSFSP